MAKLVAKIQSLRRDELDKAWQLHRQGFPYLDVISREEYLRWRSEPHFDFDQIIIAEVDGELVGKIEVYPWMGKVKRGYVDGFIVSSSYRKRGIGTQLLHEAERRAMKSGITQLELGAKTFSKDAIKLYLKLGYVKLHSVFFMRISTDKLQISRLPNDVRVRPADPRRDPKELIEMRRSVWWSEYATEKALRTDIERNPKKFLVLEHKGKAHAHIKYGLGRDIDIYCFGITRETTIPLPALAKRMLSEVLAKATNQKTLRIEVDERENKLLETLKSLGFDNYETEFHMRKQL